MRRIVDVVILIGKLGLSYRGKDNKAAYILDDAFLDHGNFLEIIILLSIYDQVIKLHLDKVIEQKVKSHNSESKQGIGNIKFLFKTIVNYIVKTISRKIKSFISKEIQAAGIYSVQIDTTQDISVVDQCSVLIRFVNGTCVVERLIGIFKCTSSKGTNLAQLILSK